MNEKDDNIMDNLNSGESGARTPYDFVDDFSSPYDSFADLENEIKKDSEDGEKFKPISQFNVKNENNNIIFISAAIVVFILIIGVVLAINKDYIKFPKNNLAFSGKEKKVKQVDKNAEAPKREVNISTINDEEVDRILKEYNKNNGGEDVLPDLPAGMQNGQFPPIDNDIVVGRMPLGNVGRLDPFNPVGSNSYADVMAPPTSVTPDTDAQAIMTAKITGILYTEDSPSAIVNIAGSDQLVKAGDKVDNFKIVKISKDKVTIRTGKNVYAAAVGELVSADAVGVRDVPNLKKKFAGPYSGGGRVIEINSTN